MQGHVDIATSQITAYGDPLNEPVDPDTTMLIEIPPDQESKLTEPGTKLWDDVTQTISVVPPPPLQVFTAREQEEAAGKLHDPALSTDAEVELLSNIVVGGPR